jgi:hypothetical protein
MLIEVTVTPTTDTEKKLFDRPQALINFRAGMRRATEMLEREVERNAPKATGDFLASISSTTHEYGDPFRSVARIYSTHPAADVIEFGAEPHTVPIRSILRWMQAVNMNIKNKKTPEEVAHMIQHKIEEYGLKPHHTFTRSYDSAEDYFHSALDPVLDAIGGEAEYATELRSSGSYVASYPHVIYE